MKTKKAKTFGKLAKSPTATLLDAMADVEAAMIAYDELLVLRNRVSSGQLTPELFDFLNAHCSLETLFQGLPPASRPEAFRPEDLEGCELRYIDAALEGIFGSIKDAIVRMWRAFCDWVLDWTDTNRRRYFRLRRHLTRLKSTRTDYGSPESFSKAVGEVYMYATEWNEMFKAVEYMSNQIRVVPGDTVGTWLLAHMQDFKDKLALFGYTFTSDGDSKLKLKYNGPHFIPVRRPLGQGGAGWSFNNLQTIVEQTMRRLKDEEESRGVFNAVKKAFDKAIAPNGNSTEENRKALVALVAVVKCVKEQTSIVARAVDDVCNIARRNA